MDQQARESPAFIIETIYYNETYSVPRIQKSGIQTMRVSCNATMDQTKTSHLEPETLSGVTYPTMLRNSSAGGLLRVLTIHARSTP